MTAPTPAPEFVVVPREPTEEMIEAYCQTIERHGFTSWVNLSAIWPELRTAMIAASPPRPLPTVEEEARETGWLIEHRDDSGPSWMTLKPDEALWGLVWTKDSTEAVRFARRADAEAYYACHIDDAPNTFITEHAWS